MLRLQMVHMRCNPLCVWRMQQKNIVLGDKMFDGNISTNLLPFFADVFGDINKYKFPPSWLCVVQVYLGFHSLMTAAATAAVMTQLHRDCEVRENTW